jgi:hypothetical protein
MRHYTASDQEAATGGKMPVGGLSMLRTLPPRPQLSPKPPRSQSDTLASGFDQSQPLHEAVAEEQRSAKRDDASPAALSAALRLARNPTLASKLQAEELPAGIPRLIRVIAEPAVTASREAQVRGIRTTLLHKAAVFYLEQVLWMEGGSHLRALGLQPGASADEIADAAWRLMEWLHPFIGRADQEAAFADRVLEAWTALKRR